MLNFKKKGLICDFSTLNLSWFKKNTMTPITYLLNDEVLRIFLGMCDIDNVGRIGYIDVNANNPKEILNYSKTPVLDIGESGCFDDSGVLPSSILEENGRLYMFYSGYQKHIKIPYSIFTGLSISNDKGKTFERFYKAPILAARKEELFLRSSIFCLKIDNMYKFWYSSGNSFIHNNIKLVPKYNINYLECDSLLDLYNINKQSITCLDIENDEYGLAMPNVFIEESVYKMIYSIRTVSKGYRIGYAESIDNGTTWIRKDDQIDLDVSDNGWDSEMVCFGHLQQVKNKKYMFYCGNHYGIGGLGYAEIIQE